MKREQKEHTLGDLLDEKVYPALFERLDSAFPEYGWRKSGDKWTATSWPADFPFPVQHENPDRLMVYRNRPWWVKVHGHEGVRFLELVNGGRKPEGVDFVNAVRRLCELAGVPFPERERTAEEARQHERREARREALEVVARYAERTLWGPGELAEKARAFVRSRGLTDEEARELRLGLYASAREAGAELARAGFTFASEDEEKHNGVFTPLEGHVVIPWADAYGRLLTLYGRWHEKKPPEGRAQNMGLPGEGTKASPLYFDRARAAGHRDLVAVEGLFDVLLLQLRGDSRVVGYVAAQFSGDQVETLARHRVQSVIIVPDPDKGGDRGALSSVASLHKAGVRAYVAPRLPDGLDPDEYLLREGLEGWRRHLAGALPGNVHAAKVAMGGVSPASPDTERRAAVDRVVELVERMEGPRAGLDREDVLARLAEATGYTAVALFDLAEEREKARRRREAEKALEEALREAGETRGKGSPVEVARVLSDRLVEVVGREKQEPPPYSAKRMRAELASAPDGLSSGWSALDRLGVRFNPLELSVVAGRPGHGKTTALVQLLHNWLLAGEKEDRDEVVLFYSFEEPVPFLAARLVALLSAEEGGRGWSMDEVRAFDKNPHARHAWTSSPASLDRAWKRHEEMEGRLQVVWNTSWTAADLVAHARLYARRRPVRAVLVDYIQKIPPGGGGMSGGEDRRDIALSLVGRALKALAVDLEVPVVAGAQLNRESAQGVKLNSTSSYSDALKSIAKRRPSLEHLREGGVEQEVDLALGLLNYRADFREVVDGRGEGSVPDVTRLDVGVLKSRYGRVGAWTQLAFEGRLQRIGDADPDEVDEDEGDDGEDL